MDRERKHTMIYLGVVQVSKATCSNKTYNSSIVKTTEAMIRYINVESGLFLD
jgi:hypothetical protein